jgi:two-component system, LuxR family, sensor histidine kinase TtrS
MSRLAVLLLLVVAAALAAGRSASSEEVRTVGVLAHRGDEAARKRWQPTLEAVGQVMRGYRFEAVPLSLDGVRAALARGEIDYLFTNPGHLYRLAERYRLSPMAALRTDREGKPATGNRFGAVIFVRADNAGVATLADLKGRKLAAVAPDAFGGFEMASATLARNGVNPWRDLQSVAFLGFPQEAIVQAVMDGTADAGTVRTGVLESAVTSGKLEVDGIRILNPLRVPNFDYALSTELVPEWILSSVSQIAEPERRQFAIALLSLETDDPAVVAGNYGGWTTVPADAVVRQMLETVDRANPALRAPGSPISGAAIAAIAMVCLVLAALLYFRRQQRRSATGGSAGTVAPTAPDIHLTPREHEILALVGNGLTTKEIARNLGISPKTVEFHRGHLMRKYEAHNMAELVRKAGDLPALRAG